MLRENVMRGGIFLLLLVVLGAPLASAAPGPSRSVDADTGVSVPGWMDPSGWMEVFERLLRVLTEADDGDGGGGLDPNGTPCETTNTCPGGEGTTGTTGTTTTEPTSTSGP